MAMWFSNGDIQALCLTFELASITSAVLLVLGAPTAWWLARHNGWVSRLISAFIALPFILPPSVLGFYLLLTLGPHGIIGHITQVIGLGVLPFTFSGLVVASVIYSAPFMIQPLQTSFESLDEKYLDIAATLGFSPLQRFFRVVLPLSKSGFLTAAIMTFAHTVGEFGVVLMIGGSIPGHTKVVSMQIYEYVEDLDYTHAHVLSAFLLVFSYVVLLILNFLRRGDKRA